MTAADVGAALGAITSTGPVPGGVEAYQAFGSEDKRRKVTIPADVTHAGPLMLVAVPGSYAKRRVQDSGAPGAPKRRNLAGPQAPVTDIPLPPVPLPDSDDWIHLDYTEGMPSTAERLGDITHNALSGGIMIIAYTLANEIFMKSWREDSGSRQDAVFDPYRDGLSYRFARHIADHGIGTREEYEQDECAFHSEIVIDDILVAIGNAIRVWMHPDKCRDTDRAQE